MRSAKVPVLEPVAMDSIVFESVHKFFRHTGFLFLRRKALETHALRGLSLRVAAGEVVGLLGPNGSGKSTTLKLVSTVLLPDRGRLLVQGHDILRAGSEVRRSVGYALASERSFFPRLTIRENLEFFAALESMKKREAVARVRSLLPQVGLMDDANKQAMKLSSGMYQRLAIARALIKKPAVLLLDEPTRSLDAAATIEIWKLMRRIADDGVSVLVATHNFEEATTVCDRVALLQRGELIDCRQIGSLSAAKLRDFYLKITHEEYSPGLQVGVPA